MTDSSGRIERWVDAEMGDFTWTGGVWIGSCEFNGRLVRLELDPDNTDPSREEQIAVFEPARGIVGKLRTVEPALRRQAAEQVAEDVLSQQSSEGEQATLPSDRFAASLELQGISIHGCGELHYSSAEFFPGWTITVHFDEEISFGEAEAYEAVNDVEETGGE